MALLWYDGLDTYASYADAALAGWGSIQSPSVWSTTGGRFNGCYFQTANSWNTRVLASPATELWTGFCFNPYVGTQNDLLILQFNSSLGTETSMSYNCATFELKIWRGSTSTLLANAFVPMASGSWNTIEVRNKFDPNLGEMEVWVNGQRKHLITGVNTRTNSAATGVNVIGYGSNSNTANIRYDDLYCLDTSGPAPYNTRLGDFRIQNVLPTSDAGPNNGVTQSGTAHYAMVSDNPGYNTTNYNDLTASVGQEERYGVSTLSGTIGTVYGVRVVAVGNKSDAGIANCHTEVVSGGVVASGSSWPLLTTYSYKGDIFLIDPKTGAAWTSAALAAMQIGIVVE